MELARVVLPLWTDGAMLVAFDPVVCEHLDSEEIAAPFHRNRFVREGLAALVELPGDGTFDLLIASSPLDAFELGLVHHSTPLLGFSVRSGRVYFSGMDLPGSPPSIIELHGAGEFVELANGDYNVIFHSAIDGAPFQYIAVLTPRSGPFEAPTVDPRLVDFTPDEIAAMIAEFERNAQP